MSAPIITLTTDFGTRDAYVASMKGVILAINPDASIVDLSHQIRPQDVAQAAFVLGTVYNYFPADTIHVVVDPGVGTSREALLLTAPQGLFLAPNNGVLTYVLKEQGAGGERWGAFMEPLSVPVPPGCAAYALAEPRYWLHPVSSTFHGRDVFAPVAAHLSLGVSPGDVGRPLHRVLCFNVPEPESRGGVLIGRVVHVDHFGNLITNIAGKGLPGGELQIEVKGQRIKGLSPSYAQGGHLLAIIGSHGYLEVSVQEGSAAATLGADIGDQVSVYAQWERLENA